MATEVSTKRGSDEVATSRGGRPALAPKMPSMPSRRTAPSRKPSMPKMTSTKMKMGAEM